ncbi:hypothetical protein NL676_039501 [Syzygium grande]|nr:hypothetical protein NL676_039501 [Syzygium grande]
MAMEEPAYGKPATQLARTSSYGRPSQRGTAAVEGGTAERSSDHAARMREGNGQQRSRSQLAHRQNRGAAASGCSTFSSRSKELGCVG